MLVVRSHPIRPERILMKITKQEHDLFAEIGVQAASIAYLKLELERQCTTKSVEAAEVMRGLAYDEMIKPMLVEFEASVKKVLYIIEKHQK